MKTKTSIYIATSLDGFIADQDGKIDWLNFIPIPKDIDMGFYDFMDRIDALVMGRTTFETVCNFDSEWPYKKPVFVLSNRLTEIPQKYKEKAHLVSGPLSEIVKQIHQKGLKRLYIDGGMCIQSFLKEDLIDEMIITTIPVLLGGGAPLFSNLDHRLYFECKKSIIYIDKIIQNHFIRARE